MPAKGKGKRKVTAGPMDPRKTREPVKGHPEGNLNEALDSVMLSPPPTDKDYDSDSSMATTTITAPQPTTVPTTKPFQLAPIPAWKAKPLQLAPIPA